MLVNEQGRGRLLLTFSAAAFAAQATMTRVSRAPPTVVERLEQRRADTFAQEKGESVLDARAWSLACVPVQPFPTRSDRYYALLEAPAPFDVSPNTVLGLRGYLQGQA